MTANTSDALKETTKPVVNNYLNCEGTPQSNCLQHSFNVKTVKSTDSRSKRNYAITFPRILIILCRYHAL